MILSAIAAIGRNSEIGRRGQLPWPRLPEDMRWFVRNTRGKPMILGRVTWDSLPVQPLPGRPNLVLTRTWPGAAGPSSYLGCDLVKSPEAAIEAARQYSKRSETPEAMVIGGARIYRTFWDRLDRLYLTRVVGDFLDADAFFPEVSEAEWTEREATWVRDGAFRLGFFVYDRR